jgi:hypothetical protein
MVAFYKTKGWYKSKTIWGSIGTAVLGVLALFDIVPPTGQLESIIEAAFVLLAGFTAFGRVTATESIGSETV